MGVEWRTPPHKDPTLMGAHFNLVCTWGKEDVDQVKADIIYGDENNWFGLGFDGFISQYAVAFTMKQLVLFFEAFDDPNFIWRYLDPIGSVGNPSPSGSNQYQKKESAKVDNINITTKQTKGGTSSTYLVRRLKRDNPEIYDRVVKGELSPHRGAVVAGLKKEMVSVELSVQGFYKAIQRKLSKDQIETLKNLL